jgi:hypothetical protein
MHQQHWRQKMACSGNIGANEKKWRMQPKKRHKKRASNAGLEPETIGFKNVFLTA